ncbi:MAG: sugar phosphate isomerase/epimerase family protein [Verrucomicrobiales bacterium]
MNTQRRDFLRSSSAAAGALLLPTNLLAQEAAKKKRKPPLFKLSIAQWSFHKALFAKKMDNLDFPGKCKEMGVNGVEYVNQFFKEKAKDQDYLKQLKGRCTDNKVKSILIMIDGEGNLGEPDEGKRQEAVDRHKPWVEAAKFLGCHSIRVNARSSGSFEEQQKLAADGLRRLSEFAKPLGMNVIVENHGGLSSNGQWLAGTIKSVGLDNCGTLPDFGNFRVSKEEMYDRYKGTAELMPYAKGVSAKSHDFDEEGNETHTDYKKMLKIVLDAGYRGHIGVEYEGGKLSEDEGVKATLKLLRRLRKELTPEYAKA